MLDLECNRRAQNRAHQKVEAPRGGLPLQRVPWHAVG